MFERYKFSLRQVWSICSKPDATLRYETLLNAFYGRNILKQYIMPQAEMLLFIVFIASLLYSEFNFASAIVSAIFNCFSFVVSYGVLCFLVRWVSLRWFVKQFDVRNVSIMVASLMSVTFVANLFTALMPNMFFLKLFYVYMFYLVWVMSEGVVDVSEENRNKYMVLIALLVIVVPIVIMLLLKKMVPNL